MYVCSAVLVFLIPLGFLYESSVGVTFGVTQSSTQIHIVL